MKGKQGFHQSLKRRVVIIFTVIILSMSPFFINNYIVRSASGIDSTIKYLFVVEHSHLDIGFTDPPDEVADFYKLNIDQAVENCKSDPDYVWTIEEIWQLEQWMMRSNSSEIEELMNLTKQGRIGLTAGYATMHSGVMGHEEVNRFLYPGAKIAEEWNISIQTLIQNDVPGYSWALPQTLNKSGVKYMVTGINTWIDLGKPDIPMSDMPFYWEGPDGSKVLTWISFDAYIEGFFTYGLTDLQTAYNSLNVTLPQLEDQGYMYDAVLVLRAGDNQNTDLIMTQLARQWNNTYDNPKIVLAHPSDFFNYITGKYGNSFPTYRGDWTSWWDILGMTQPQSIRKNRWMHDNILTAEKVSTINELLGLSSYPVEDVQLAYQKAMEFDEHMTGGAPWPGLMTVAEARRQNEILYGYADMAYNKTDELLNHTLETLIENIESNDTMIIIFNPLSWNRTDLVRVNVSDTLFSQAFQLIDSDTGLPVEYQKLTKPGDINGPNDGPDGKVDMRDIGLVARYFGETVPPAPEKCDLTGPTPGVPDGTVDMRDIGLVARYFGENVPYKQMIFVAQEVPSLGYKKYEMVNSPPSSGSSMVNISGNIIENSFYEITLNDLDGHITSVYDKEQNRELVNGNSEFDFNGAIKSTNAQLWLGEYSEVPVGICEITVGLNGPVAKSLIIQRSGSPFIETEVILYDDLKRVDLVNTMNRALMDWVPIDVGHVFYAYNFPFNLTDFNTKLEIANSFMTPLSDQLPDANTAYFTTQHGLELYETSYGITWASKETFTHEFEGINLYSTTFSPTEATLTSRFLKKEDEGQFTDWQGSGFTGPIVPEPGASPILIHTYSFTTHEGSFDPVNTTRFLWSHSNPLIASEAPSNPTALLSSSSLSFFSVNSSNVILLNVKKADFGGGYIVRLLEIAGYETVFTLSSQYFTIDQAVITSNIEKDIDVLTIHDGEVITSIGPYETLSIRLYFPSA